MTIPTELTWPGGSIILPYQPWLDSPVERFHHQDCCVWVHLQDGFSVRVQKDGSRTRIYHKRWDASNGPVIDLRGSLRQPSTQEEFDAHLRGALETINDFAS